MTTIVSIDDIGKVISQRIANEILGIKNDPYVILPSINDGVTLMMFWSNDMQPDDVEEWCQTHLSNYTLTGDILYIKSQDDFVLFKLRWD